MLYIFLNKQAGSGQAAQEWPELAHQLLRRGMAFQLLTGNTLAEYQASLQSVPPDATVLAVGGDGTARAVLPAMVGTQRRLALVPYGTGNDLAGMLGLKSGDIDMALDQLANPPQYLDTLSISFQGHSHLSLSGVGMGFDAEVNKASDNAPPWITQLLGGIGRYAWGAMVAFGKMRFIPLELWLDGQLIQRGPSCLCAVMNSTRYGGGFYISPASDVSDGRLNALCTTGHFGSLELLRLMLLVIQGQHLGHRHVRHQLGQSARVRWGEAIRIQVDGDLFENVQEVDIQLRAKSLLIHTPSNFGKSQIVEPAPQS